MHKEPGKLVVQIGRCARKLKICSIQRVKSIFQVEKAEEISFTSFQHTTRSQEPHAGARIRSKEPDSGARS